VLVVVIMVVMVVVIVVVRQARLRSIFASIWHNDFAFHRPCVLHRGLNSAINRAASWCVLAIVLVGFPVVLMRYVLGIGSIWLRESILYATANCGSYVRVDLFYADASPHTKAWIDLAGAAGDREHVGFGQ
jgi:hypothetical protein